MVAPHGTRDNRGCISCQRFTMHIRDNCFGGWWCKVCRNRVQDGTPRSMVLLFVGAIISIMALAFKIVIID